MTALLEKLSEVLDPWDYEIIFVDDCSPDRTGELVNHAMKTNPRIRLISRPSERGLAGAVLRGFFEASGAILGTINADLSHDTAVIPLLIRAIENGAEMSIASRNIRGGGIAQWPWYRRLGSIFATIAARRLLHLSVADPLSGFYFMRRCVFERARNDLCPGGFKTLLSLLIAATPSPIVEVPYLFTDRKHGSSKMSAKVVVSFLKMLWRLRQAHDSTGSQTLMAAEGGAEC